MIGQWLRINALKRSYKPKCQPKLLLLHYINKYKHRTRDWWGENIYSPLPTIPRGGIFINLTLVALAAGSSLGRRRTYLIGELGNSNWACSVRPLPVLGLPSAGVRILLWCLPCLSEALQLKGQLTKFHSGVTCNTSKPWPPVYLLSVTELTFWSSVWFLHLWFQTQPKKSSVTTTKTQV